MAVALALPSLGLTDDEQRLVAQMRSRIGRFARKNQIKQDFYEAKQRVEHLDIAVPPQLRDLAVACGWPGTVVDVLEERLDWLGWATNNTDVLGLDDVYRDNYLALESSRAHTDALIVGTDFIAVGKGDESAGEPEVLVTVESPSSCTAMWNYRTRRNDAALSQTRDEHGHVVLESLYLPNTTIRFERGPDKKLGVVDRDDHGLNRVPVVRMRNRDRASDLEGRSEITRAVRYYTDAACRTLLGMEINREYYTAPQRYALGADPETFGVNENSSQDEKIMAGWHAAMGRLNIVPRDEDGELPEMGQFDSNPPTPYAEQLRVYSQFVSSESGIPSPYLGFVTENPPSGDAIRQAEYRLVKRAERRQAAFGMAWREVAYLVLLVRDREVDREAFRRVYVNWRDAATPTRSATADEAIKLVGSGVLLPDSRVTYDRIGLAPQDQERLEDEKRRSRVDAVIRNLPAAAAAARQDPQVAAAVSSRGTAAGE
ncbi:phage portal protein [Nocardia brasiliensis]|uniref:phage portal protein n=1 Tax=Nocardia brasiliensis TaxID=37326 RepID=UPI002454AB90|nr:phage portal protein [Nocardia brasiliensis]